MNLREVGDSSRGLKARKGIEGVELLGREFERGLG